MPLPATTRSYRIRRIQSNNKSTNAHIELTSDAIPPLATQEVLVKIHAVSLNFRDLMILNGLYPVSKDHLVPCSDAAGEVISVGKRVTKWKAGDRVVCSMNSAYRNADSVAMGEKLQETSLGAGIDGVLTEYRCFLDEALVRIPQAFTYEQASTLPCAALTAWNALTGPYPVKAGDHVLIQGTGGVSCFGMQFARALGASAIVTSSSDEKLEKAQRLGATYTINYLKKPDWEGEVLRITKDRGADHVLEVCGAPNILRSVKATRYGGHLHNIGVLAGFDGDGQISDLLSGLLMKTITLRSIQTGSIEQFEAMIQFINAKIIFPKVDKIFDFAHAREAYDFLASKAHIGKVVIRVSEERKISVVKRSSL
ncbi:hypothetical protein EIP91_003434 [Steccherinum ochraceum]|uniref:Enoyl reductase (ER) domain-containing protein n=1 Tax=Steccherinum ochraceum TaxID=92696 RepID=A0A4V2MW55_9APHY|nr:hypothetical protein EIP91_003434 [Steccherinum ochraceum]